MLLGEGIHVETVAPGRLDWAAQAQKWLVFWGHLPEPQDIPALRPKLVSQQRHDVSAGKGR